MYYMILFTNEVLINNNCIIINNFVVNNVNIYKINFINVEYIEYLLNFIMNKLFINK